MNCSNNCGWYDYNTNVKQVWWLWACISIRNVSNVKHKNAFWLGFFFLIRLRKVYIYSYFYVSFLSETWWLLKLYQMPFHHLLRLLSHKSLWVEHVKLYRVWQSPDILLQECLWDSQHERQGKVNKARLFAVRWGLALVFKIQAGRLPELLLPHFQPMY